MNLIIKFKQLHNRCRNSFYKTQDIQYFVVVSRINKYKKSFMKIGNLLTF